MKDNKKIKSDISNILVSIVFLLIIGSFFAASFIASDKDFSENENRDLAEMPELSLDAAADGSFSKGFESYVQDQFPARESFMSLKTAFEKAVGKKDNGLVYFGDDGYLFAVEDIDKDQLYKNISYINKFAKENDVRAGLMVVPTASYVLDDKLPEFLNTSSEENAFDIIEKNSDIKFLDVRDILDNHADEYIYYKTDHHWTTLGAFYAYKSVIGQNKTVSDYKVTEVCDDFLGTNYSKVMLSSIEPDSIYRYDSKSDDEGYTMDIYDNGKKTESFSSLYDEKFLQLKDKYSYFLSGNNPVTVIEGNKEKVGAKNILVVKDSFAHCFIPFMAEDCGRIVAVDMRYYRNGLKDIIAEYDIQEVLFLYNILNFSNDTNLVFINR